MSFCNLIVLGEGLLKENSITVTDFFAKTFRVQDSAVIAVCKGTARELMSTATPLDNISSFAIQKILLKDAGLDRDIAVSDIRKFAIGYYARTSSSYMPIVKVLPQTGGGDSGGAEGGNQSGGSQSGGQFGNKGQSLYDLTNTALFKNGSLVGRLDTPLTFTFNMLKGSVSESLLHVENADGEGVNYVLTILRNSSKISLSFTNDILSINVKLGIYCKVSDVKKTGTDSTYANNHKLNPVVKNTTENMLKDRIISLYELSKSTKCDFLGLDDILYKYYHSKYDKFKDKLFSDATLNVSVNITAQK
jgi:Ger(x)C family germination protein